MTLYMTPTSMLVAEVGEPPDVAEPHRVAEAGQEEVALVVPVASLALHLHHTSSGHDYTMIYPPLNTMFISTCCATSVSFFSPRPVPMLRSARWSRWSPCH